MCMVDGNIFEIYSILFRSCYYSGFLFLFCAMATTIRYDDVLGEPVSDNNCRQFSQNNRRVYECINATFRNISPIPTGTMILRILNSTIPRLSLLNNKDIVTVIMNFCNLSDVSPEAFIFANNLRKLDLSHNLLNNLQFRSNSYFAIEKLVLSRNEFRNVPDLHPLRQLTHLDLSYNKISYLTDYDLILPNLEVVDLSHNELQSLNPADLGEVTRILVLDGNPWRCDCHLRHFVAFQRKTLIAKSSRCFEPIQIRGTKWDDLSLMEFACGPVITAPLLETLQITEGETASFLCIVWGDPTPVVQWYRNGFSRLLHSDGDRVLVEAAATANGTSYYLMHIRQTIPDDQTTYWCKATTGFVTKSKRFNLQINSIRPVNSEDEDDEQLNLPISGKEPAKSRENSGGLKQPTIQRARSFWQLMLLIVVLFAVVLFFLACCVLCVYWCRIQSRRRGSSSTPSEEKPLHRIVKPRTITVATVPAANDSDEILQAQSLKVQMLQNGEPSLTSGSSRSGDELARKAPLAQYDRDTSVLPLVQTSL